MRKTAYSHSKEVLQGRHKKNTSLKKSYSRSIPLESTSILNNGINDERYAYKSY